MMHSMLFLTVTRTCFSGMQCIAKCLRLQIIDFALNYLALYIEVEDLLSVLHNRV